VGGIVAYDEGVFIGYRAWDRGTVEPRYPFGHGGGYTSWSYDSMVIDGRHVAVTLRNSGTRPGREVVQCYVSPIAADPDRPRRWLAGFAVVTAEPDTTVTVTIELPDRAFQIWADGGWRTVAGRYEIAVAHSIAEPRLSSTVTIG
jgi:beta-glucosidase